MKKSQLCIGTRAITFSKSSQRISDIFGNGEFMPDDSFMKVVTEIECKAERNERAICSNMLFFLFGYDEPQFNYVSESLEKSNQESVTLQYFRNRPCSRGSRATRRPARRPGQSPTTPRR